jgi:hypothetical protein
MQEVKRNNITGHCALIGTIVGLFIGWITRPGILGKQPSFEEVFSAGFRADNPIGQRLGEEGFVYLLFVTFFMLIVGVLIGAAIDSAIERLIQR